MSQVFIDACLDGHAKLHPGSAEQVGFDALPAELRQNLGTPASSQVWRLSDPGQGFLYVLTYEGKNGSSRVCGLASDEMDYDSAAQAVEQRVTGTVHSRSTRTVQWLNPKAGYDTLATTAGTFKVLQVNWLSDWQRALELQEVRTIPQ